MSVKPKMHALWLFDVVDDKETALMYFKTAIEKFPEHGMVPLTIGRFRAAQKGDLAPRQYYVLGEWESEEAFKKFADNEALAETHAQRENTMTRQIRHLFDGIFLLDPDFKFEDLERLVNNS
jgi:heme-degrading monooxygenase HmoA